MIEVMLRSPSRSKSFRNELNQSQSPKWSASQTRRTCRPVIVKCMVVPSCRMMGSSPMQQLSEYPQSASSGYSDPTQGSTGAVVPANMPANATDGTWPVQQASVSTTPRELCKVTLPRYVIEAPDILLIEAINSLGVPDTP